MKHKKLLQLIMIPILSVVFIFTTAMVIRYVVRSHSEQKAFEELASITGAANAQEQVPSLDTNVSEENYISPYLPLKEQNADFFGWISIEGTKIDYPVMYTPDDPEYYLHRAFDKNSSQSGVPFLDATCSLECGNYLIYGHNMSNGTMFADLLSYADHEFWEEHPTIQFDTLDGTGSYFIFAAFYSEIYLKKEDGFHYYQYTDLHDAENFDAYINQVKKAALYDTGITLEYGDMLLTLSTCSYHTTNGRFVVVARQCS